MKTKFTLFLILLSIFSFAQTQYEKSWDQVLGSIYDEEPVLISANPNGKVDVIANVVGMNNANAQGFDVTKGYGGYDIWFCKLDANGKVIPNSDKTYGTAGEERARCAIRTTDGGYLICARVKNGNTPTADQSGLELLKIDTAGTVIWDQNIYFDKYIPSGNGAPDLTGDIAVCNSNTGYCLSLLVHSNGAARSYFTFFLNIDAKGNYNTPIIQSSTTTLADALTPKSLIQLKDGNVAMGGVANSSGFMNILNPSSAALIRGRQYASAPYNEINYIKEIGIDEFVFFSRSSYDNSSSAVRTVPSKASSNNHDLWILSLNINAQTNIQNALGCGSKNLENTKNYILNNIYIKDSLAYILLEPDAKGMDVQEAIKGKTDYWLVVYNYYTKKIIYQNTYGGKGNEYVQSICVDDYNNVYLLGTSDSPIDGDKTVAIQSGITDLWLLKLCAPVPPPKIADAINISGGNYVVGCAGTKKDVSILNPTSSYTYTWYTAASGGTSFASGTTVASPFNLSDAQVQRVYVESNYIGCINRTAVNLIGNPTPKAPLAVGKTLVCKGSSSTLKANRDTSSDPFHFYSSRWYDSTGTNIIAKGDSYTLNNIQYDKKLFLSTIDSFPAYQSSPAVVCESPLTPVTITVDIVPDPVVTYTNPKCLYNSTVLVCSNAGNNKVSWYDSKMNILSTTSSFTYKNKKMQDTVYTQLETLNGCASAPLILNVIEVQNDMPVVPQITDAINISGYTFVMGCAGTKKDVSVLNPNSFYTYTWYAAASGGTAIGTGAQLTTPFNVSESNIQNVYVESNNKGCVIRTQVSVFGIHTPGAPVAVGKTLLCKGTDITLTAQREISSDTNRIYSSRWYDSTGTNIISRADTLKLSNIQQTTKLFLSTIDSFPAYQSSPAIVCESPLTPVTITVDQVPDPVVTYTNPSCLYNSTVLVCSNASSYNVTWYDSKMNVLSSANSLSYTGHSAQETIFIQLTSKNGCSSPLITSLIKPQHDTPLPPLFVNAFDSSGSQNIPSCTGYAVNISVLNPDTSLVYYWFNTSTGGNSIFNGKSFSTPVINSAGKYEYWVNANNGTCQSTRRHVLIDKVITPAVPVLTAPAKICQNDTLLLIAKRDTATLPGTMYLTKWKDSAGQVLHTGDTLLISNVQKTRKYFCSVLDSVPAGYFPGMGVFTCESKTVVKEVIVDSVALPQVTISGPSCVGSNVAVTITNLVNATCQWFNPQGYLLGTGQTFYIYNLQKKDTINCTVTGTNGCKNYKEVYVNAEKPISLFTAPRTILSAGDVIQFNNQSIGDSTAVWDFGDGSISYNLNPYHYFYQEGKFTIRLIARTGSGCADTLTRPAYIIVNPLSVPEITILGGIKIFPNPFKDKIQIDLTKNIPELHLTLTNSLGQVILQKTIKSSELLNPGTLPAGPYFLRIQSGDQEKTIKLFRQ